MDVAAWLRDLGLHQYERLFSDNEIDASVLPKLTDEHLKELGLPLGHRLKLLEAIAAFYPDLKPVEAAPNKRQPATAEAERRQLTVMFCDLVGSTGMASRLDPEDLREIISAYHRCVSDIVARFEGFVAKYMGDGVLVYFGYPKAHEDDAERAVRAGLLLTAAIAQLPTPDRCQIRIGIGTGLVVVGDLTGSGEAQERGVVGETPNLAARLQTLAQPGSIVIGPTTRRLLGDLFEYRDLGTVSLKGFAKPVQVYQVLRSSAFASRFEAMRALALTPLTGREEEIELLMRRWRRAKRGEGQVVLVSGEPGIGKSRIVAALSDQIKSDPHTRLRFFCSPYHTDSALHPVIAQWERAAGFGRDDDAGVKLAKLATLIAPSAPAEEELALLSEMLSLPNPKLSSTDFSPQRKKEKTLEVLLHQLRVLVRNRPVVIVFEDLHWIDPTSRELLDLVVEGIRQLPVLLLLTFRPEFQPPWTGQAHVALLALNRLDRREGTALVELVLGNKALPPEVVAEIVDRTDGVPLFIEELTKAVVEGGAGNNDPSATTRPGLVLPATLHASLMARLDRLGQGAKETAQIGAVIGREFSYELLRAVWQRSDADLQATLGQLVEAGLVYCRGRPPQAIYLFKHALVQDASYGTLLRGRRQFLHARIVAAMEERFPSMAEQQPGLLAQHCAGAGLFEKAVAYFGIAGRQLLARSAMVESIAQVRKGLDLLPHLAEGPERWRAELDLQRVLGAALLASKGNSAPETGSAYARARKLCEQLGDIAALVPVMGGLSTCYQTRCEFSAMRQISEDLLRIGRTENDSAATMVGSRSMGLCLYHLGKFVAARKHFERVLRLYSPERHHALASVTSFDMRAAALSYLSLDLLILGYAEQSALASQQALAGSRNLPHVHNLAFTLNYAVVHRLIAGDEAGAATLLEELSSLATEHRFPVWTATASVMRGYLLSGGKAPEQGLAMAKKGLSDRAAQGSSWHGTFYLGLLAFGCQRAGHTGDALDLAAAALAMVEETDERWFAPELYRHRGGWLARQGRTDEAESCLRTAVDLARQQSAKLWELRSATDLARLWQGRGRRTEANDLLAPTYGWFTEGSNTCDLISAKQVLDAS